LRFDIEVSSLGNVLDRIAPRFPAEREEIPSIIVIATELIRDLGGLPVPVRPEPVLVLI
jgi:hypothetical protein